jgi:hypothetical protein
MSQQDPGSAAVYSPLSQNHKALTFAIEALLKTTRFESTVAARCWWTARTLVATALLWAWSDEKNLVDRYRVASDIIAKGTQRRIAPSYQAFMKVLRRHSHHLLQAVCAGLRRTMKRQLARHWKWFGRAVFVVDGSLVNLPHTKSNEAAYAKTRRRTDTRRYPGAQTTGGIKRTQVPQIYLTVLWHLNSRLPWDWRSGPSNAWESEDLLSMLPDLPPRSLIIGDAGFIGYDLWKAINDGGHDFLIRVGANVHLLKKLGFIRESGSTVYCWPNQKYDRWQPPLVYRLVVLGGGKKPVYLLTSLKASEMSDRQISELYARRWGVELFYRALKQTFGRVKLRSHRADHAMCELNWSLTGLWAVQLYTLTNTEIEPGRLSLAAVLRTIAQAMREYRCRPLRGHDLHARLNTSLIDSYQRGDRTARRRVKKHPDFERKHVPRIVEATPKHRKRARQIKLRLKRLTA